MAIGVKPRKTNGLGFETAKLAMGRQLGGMPEGGMGRPPGSEGLGPQGRFGGFGLASEKPKPLKFS